MMSVPRRFVRLVAGLALLGAARSASAGEPARARMPSAVILPDGADPWVIRHDGRYLATVTTGRDVTLLRSATLSGLAKGERKAVWTPSPSGPYSREVWAPEIHRLRGKWYIYVAADDGRNANHRLIVLENEADDPFAGHFAFKAQLRAPGADRWAIDGSVLDHRGRLYFLWSGWEGTEDVRQDLYIAPMSDPWTLSGPRVRISSPTHPWETRGGPPSINEGPVALVRGGQIHIIYAAAASWTDHYCLGRLTARADADLLDPASWTKSPAPVFASANGVFGPGHPTFVKSPDGREDWLIYHAARRSGSGWSRNIRAQPFTWRPDGTPDFGRPLPPIAPHLPPPASPGSRTDAILLR